MMREYKKIIILSITLVALITVITLAMIFDVDVMFFKNLSIAGIESKKLAVEQLIQKEKLEGANNTSAKTAQQTSKNNFDVAKETYESIDDSTISIVKEATKEEKYFIEYLWVVLDNYAKVNNVDIEIITPNASGSESTTNSSSNENTESTQNEDSENASAGFSGEESNQAGMGTSQTSANTGIKITITGRYANVADFVFDVENDKELRFKLDNISMTYASDNTIKAVFDVISLYVLN